MKKIMTLTALSCALSGCWIEPEQIDLENNELPVVNQLQNLSVDEGSSLTISRIEAMVTEGADFAMYDIDGEITKWQVNFGEQTVSSNNDSLTLTPAELGYVNATSSNSASLTVFDNNGGEASIDFEITINQVDPSLSVDNQQVEAAQEVTLSAQVSDFDKAAGQLTYTWTAVGDTASLVTLEATDQANLVFTAPNLDVASSLEFSLDVTDGNESLSTTVTVDVAKRNQAPVLTPSTSELTEVGINTNVALGETFQLSVTASDEENDNLSYSWEQIAGPEGVFTAAGTDSDVLSLTLPASVTENQLFTYQVKVNDGLNEVTQNFEVKLSSGVAVTITAAEQFNIAVNQEYQISPNYSDTDANTQYLWTLPAGFTAKDDNLTSASITVIADSSVAESLQTVSVEAGPVGGVKASKSMSVGVGKPAAIGSYGTYDGSAVLLADGSVVAWGWSMTEPLHIDVSKGASPVKQIVSNWSGQAALHADGSVTSWGSSDYLDVDGNDTAAAITNAKKLVTSSQALAFVAILENGDAKIWGKPASYAVADDPTSAQADNGGALANALDTIDGSASPVIDAVGTKDGTAILHADGTVTFRGWLAPSPAITNAKALFSSVGTFGSASRDFAAILNDDGIQVWGKTQTAVVPAGLSVADVYFSGIEGVAIETDGSVTPISTLFTGKNVSATAPLDSGYIHASGTNKAITLLKTDGSVVAYGDFKNGAKSAFYDSTVAPLTNVLNMFSSAEEGGKFSAALTQDGKIYTWGQSGGTNHDMDAERVGPYNHMFFMQNTYVALKTDGSVEVLGLKAGFGEVVPEAVQAQLADVTDPAVEIAAKGKNTLVQFASGKVAAWGDGTGYLPLADTASAMINSKYPVFFDNADTDGDGISNGEERASCVVPYAISGGLPCLSAGNADTDGDGLSDKVEQDGSTSPLHPYSELFKQGDSFSYPTTPVVRDNLK
ncbi:hypothetical protein [Paraferrimonas sp. SM1919]|uniref:PKD domain-containing protein n=1 Tax=Paraferrimonas sp. SM1919 TaxID=2662263 RepID=UPI0013D6A41A|nr:hypothetical protein [Paraferrimonas sp. SM1919]